MSSHTDLIAALNDVPVSDTERVQPPRHALVRSTGQRKRGLAGGSFSPCPPTLGAALTADRTTYAAPSERPRPAVVVSGCCPWGASWNWSCFLDSVAFPVQHLGKNESQALFNFMVSTIWTAPFMFTAESSPGSVCRRAPPSRPRLMRLL